MPTYSLRSFDEVVAHYRATRRDKSAGERRWFHVQRSLADAVKLAGLAQKPHGKRFPHQYRLRAETLEECSVALLASLNQIETVRDFDTLHELVCRLIGEIRGVGPLMKYDTAIRIGAYLNLHPKAVYLHAGTRRGAAALGLDINRRSLDLSDLPTPLQALSASEAEDVLCIYKDDLRKLAHRPAR